MDFSKVTAYLDSLYKTYDVPDTDCLVMQDHRTLYRHKFGWSDHAHTRPLDGNETYFVYSVTKMFTVTAVMQLVESGRIGLEDPVERYLPVYAPDKIFVNTPEGRVKPERSIRIRDLLSMTAGIPGQADGDAVKAVIARRAAEGGAADSLDIVTASASQGLNFQPGTHFEYTRGHDLLGAVIRVVTGQSYMAYVKEHICRPLGLTSTGTAQDADLMARMADQYWYRDGRSVPHEKTNFAVLTPAHEEADACIVSSVEDCARLADALACGGEGATGQRILKSETVELLRRPYLSGTPLADYKKIGKIGYNYGLGVRTLVDPTVSKSPLGEFGWDGAAGAFFLSDPVNRLSVYLAHHSVAFSTPADAIHFELRDRIYDAIRA